MRALLEHDVHASPTRHVGLSLVLARGGAVLEWMGDREVAADGDVLVFYSGYPHHLSAADDDASPITVRVPLARALCSSGRGQLGRLFEGAVVREPSDANRRAAEAAGFERWQVELSGEDECLVRAAHLDVEARVRRALAACGATATGDTERMGTSAARSVAAAAAYVAEHVLEPLPVERIARAVDISSKTMLASTRRAFGMPLTQYITRLRLAEARYLLVSTDLPVLAICHRAGFSSTARMYDAFDRLVGTTPGRFRRDAAWRRSRS